MNVLVHLNHGRNENYLLSFPKNVAAQELRGVLDGDYDKAILWLTTRSEQKHLVSSEELPKAQLVADFVLTEGCVTERLA